jgi:hypothetical protein
MFPAGAGVTRRELALIAETRAALADGSARRRREAAGVRLVEMAAVCGVASSTVSQWERLGRDGKPLRVPDARRALAYGRELAALERQAA